jgi:acyl dehydratase
VAQETADDWSLEREISQPGIDAYARVAGDFNPIHVDPQAALRGPFGGTIAHGFYVLSFGSVLLTRLFGRRWVEGGSLKARFKRATRPGDRITVRALSSASVEFEGKPKVCLELVWENQDGETVLEGTASVPQEFEPGGDGAGP